MTVSSRLPFPIDPRSHLNTDSNNMTRTRMKKQRPTQLKQNTDLKKHEQVFYTPSSRKLGEEQENQLDVEILLTISNQNITTNTDVTRRRPRTRCVSGSVGWSRWVSIIWAPSWAVPSSPEAEGWVFDGWLGVGFFGQMCRMMVFCRK